MGMPRGIATGDLDRRADVTADTVVSAWRAQMSSMRRSSAAGMSKRGAGLERACNLLERPGKLVRCRADVGEGSGRGSLGPTRWRSRM